MTTTEKQLIEHRANVLEIRLSQDQMTLLDNPNIDIDSFIDWFNAVDLGMAYNKQKYFDAMFNNNIGRNVWRKQHQIVVDEFDEIHERWKNHQSMFNVMRAFGIKVNQADTIFIQSYVDYMSDEKNVNYKSLVDLHTQIMTYMFNNKEKYKDYSSATFISLLKKSSFLGNMRVDWEQIDNSYQESKNEWETLWGLL